MLVANLAGDIIVWVVWIAAAFTLLGSGMAVVLFQNPFYSALALILNLGSLAVFYLLGLGGLPVLIVQVPQQLIGGGVRRSETPGLFFELAGG